jgi:O-antigen ligase
LKENNRGFFLSILSPVYFFILFIGGTYDGPLSWPVILSTHIIFLAGCAVLLARMFHNRTFRIAGGFIDPILLALLIYIAVRCFTSPFPRYAWNVLLWYTFLLASFYLLLQYVTREHDLLILTKIIALGTIVVSIYSLFSFASGRSIRASLPMGHHNFLGGYLVLTLPLCISVCVNPRTKSAGICTPLFWIAGSAIGIVALLTTGSLASFLSFGAVAVFLYLVGIRLPGNDGSGGDETGKKKVPGRPMRMRRFKMPRVLIVSAVSVVIIMVLAFLFLAPFRNTGLRLLDIVSGEFDDSIIARSDIYRGAVAGIFDKPLFGAGPGMTPFIFPLFRRQNPALFVPGEVISQLHNAYLHIAFELGMIGLILVLAALSSLLAPMYVRIREFRRDGNHYQWSLLPFVLASIGGYSLNALTDFQLHITGISVTFTLVAAIAVRSMHISTVKQQDFFINRRKFLPIAALSIPVAIFIVKYLVPVHRAQYHFYRATRAIEKTARRVGYESDYYNSIMQQLERSCDIDPDFGHYHFQAGLYCEWMADRARAARKSGEANQFNNRAANHLRKALECNPYNPVYNIHTGGFFCKMGDCGEAVETLKMARVLDYFSPFPPFYLGVCNHTMGRNAKAIEEFRTALLLLPKLAVSTYWLDDENRALFENVIEASRSFLELRMSKKKERPWIKRALHVLDVAKKKVSEFGAKNATVSTVMICQKDDLGERPYSLYVYRMKGMVVTSAPVELVQELAGKFSPNTQKLYMRFFPRSVAARDLLRDATSPRQP